MSGDCRRSEAEPEGVRSMEWLGVFDDGHLTCLQRCAARLLCWSLAKSGRLLGSRLVFILIFGIFVQAHPSAWADVGLLVSSQNANEARLTTVVRAIHVRNDANAEIVLPRMGRDLWPTLQLTEFNVKAVFHAAGKRRIERVDFVAYHDTSKVRHWFAGFDNHRSNLLDGRSCAPFVDVEHPRDRQGLGVFLCFNSVHADFWTMSGDELVTRKINCSLEFSALPPSDCDQRERERSKKGVGDLDAVTKEVRPVFGSLAAALLCILASGPFSICGWRLWNGRSYLRATRAERWRSIPFLIAGTLLAFEGTVGLLLGIDPYSLAQSLWFMKG